MKFHRLAILTVTLSYNIKCFLVFMLMWVTVMNSSGQELPGVILPSPQTRELNKYIDFPVDVSTGVPEISIHLYSIKTKGVEIPIALNYHASGIKYGQDDGDVGLGWSLSCNYRVSRTIRGLADSQDTEMSPALYQTLVQNWENTLSILPDIKTSADIHLAYPFRDRDSYLGRFFPNLGGGGYPFPTGPRLDGQYDRFNYILPGQSGSFIITNRFTKTVNEISPSLNRIGYIEGNATNSPVSGIIGFGIKDVNQNVYSFGEQRDKLGNLVLEANNTELDKKNATAWALTHIGTKYGENIEFNYQRRDTRTKYKRQQHVVAIDPLATTGTWQHNISDESTSSSYSIFSLSGISTDNERIEFTHDGNSSIINRIIVSRKSDNSPVRTIDFFYKEKHISPDNYLFLDSIIISAIGEPVQKYSFEYYDESHFGPLLFNDRFIVSDQWGYHKLDSRFLQMWHNDFENDHMRESGMPAAAVRFGNSTFNTTYPGRFANRKENANPELFSLKQVHYPTGGSTLYEYEPNLSGYEYLGGIRIKSISHFDENTGQLYPQPTLKRYYQYADGYNRYLLDYPDFQLEYPYISGDLYGVGAVVRGIHYSSEILGDVSEVLTGPFYTRVTESVTSSSGSNGKTVYQYEMLSSSMADLSLYEMVMDDPDGYMKYRYLGPRYVSKYSYKRKPNLLFREIMDQNGSLLKKEKYYYDVNGYEVFSGLKVAPYVKWNQEPNYYSPWFYKFFSSIYKYGLYSTEVGVSLLKEKQETIYSGTDSTVVVKNYQYNAKQQIIKETSNDSKGKTVARTVVYPVDNPYSPMSMALISNNDLGKKLYESMSINGDLVEKVAYNYSALPNNLIELYQTSVWNPSTQSLEENFTVHKYDSTGNILSMSKANDIRINYIWSYNGQYPVAEIKGPPYEDIEILLGGATSIDTFRRWNHPTKVAIDNFLAPLRTAISTGALQGVSVLSFSYDPLFGVRSQTDASGRTKYYEYDGYGRLKIIKGDNGAIEEIFDYKYRNH